MAGVILENMSTKKILIFCGILLFLQIVCFLVGGIIAPSPTTTLRVLATKCIDHTQNHRKLFPPRGKHGCDRLDNFEEALTRHIPASDITFSFQIPHGKLEMSRLFQFMVGVLTLDIEHTNEVAVGTDPTLSMVITMGYNNVPDGNGEWELLYQVNETRKLSCFLEGEEDGYGEYYDCDPLALFELSSVHHKHYLVNIRLPIEDENLQEINQDIGSIKDLHIVEIHQTGGFTIIWLTMKSVFFPLVLGMMIFFQRRVNQLGRAPLLMEKTILSLAIVMTFVNFPLEWLTLVFEIPAMLLISDIRQGACYAMLFSFWIIFIGEHMMDSVRRNSLKAYWQQTMAIGVACTGLLVFDLAERGSQLVNPFYSIWNSQQGSKLAMGFIILAAVCVCLYFCFLLFMVLCLFRNLRMKSVAFNSMPKNRKNYYQGLLYRFRFFMIFTLFSAVMTVVFFVLSQVNEVYNWHLDNEDQPQLHYTSGFFTGVYGLWNVYVLAVLFLYSPSHKDEPLLRQGPSVSFLAVQCDFHILVHSQNDENDLVKIGHGDWK
ncbi:protein wntless homolog isoform X2 [Apostichopus japonicus]|uniref:protein wntless homolog isoform X2 n=1 Tax=Stichopus japonicus TaxID=307972 RepID=UPI003AB892CA